MIAYKTVNARERVELDKLSILCYVDSEDFSKQTPPEDGEAVSPQETGRAAFVDGKMAAALEYIPYRVQFDGHQVDIVGIGGVATLPEMRNRGLIRGLMTGVFEEARQRDMPFAWLYPFSHKFYRQFGYELGQTHLEASFPMSALRDFPRQGSMHMWQPGDDLGDFIAVYQAFCRGKNMAVARTDKLWKRHFNFDPYRDRRYAYLYRDENGVPGAYMVLKAQPVDGEGGMYVQQCAYTSMDNLRHLLGWLKSLDAQVARMRWRLPDTVIPQFSDIDALSIRMVSGGMNRIIDAGRVLDMMKKPQGTGEAVFSLHDDQLPDNSGTYRIQWQDGQGEVTRTSAPAPASIDIRALAQLAIGFRGFADD
nr:GNAT family N-acetyltransferase [bacterium]